MEKAMHYYQFHIGDYRAATAHLTNDEDLAYRRLLDMYYDTETPIPLDIDWVSRRLRLGQDVIENVLKDMFKLSVDGYIHTRCDSEIQKYHSKADSARKANQIRWGSEKVLKSDADQILTNNHKPITNNQEYIDRFDIFWKQYPRKVAKPNALKFWLKIKPDDVVLKKMLDAINQQGLSSKEIQFVPHPATWLNAKRWEDEVATASSSTNEWWMNDRRIK
jgi:uncharacterized protein YdaU (DUF1376 family)